MAVHPAPGAAPIANPEMWEGVEGMDMDDRGMLATIGVGMLKSVAVSPLQQVQHIVDESPMGKLEHTVIGLPLSLADDALQAIGVLGNTVWGIVPAITGSVGSDKKWTEAMAEIISASSEKQLSRRMMGLMTLASIPTLIGLYHSVEKIAQYSYTVITSSPEFVRVGEFITWVGSQLPK